MIDHIEFKFGDNQSHSLNTAIISYVIYLNCKHNWFTFERNSGTNLVGSLFVDGLALQCVYMYIRV